MGRQILSILLALATMLLSLEMMSAMYWEHSLCLALLIGLACYPIFHGQFVDGKIDVFEPIYLFITLYALILFISLYKF